MQATLEKAFGYQGDNMNLPVPDLRRSDSLLRNRARLPASSSRSDAPHKSAVLTRDQVQIGLAENGGDPSQNGCAFHVKGLESLFVGVRLPTGSTRSTPNFDVGRRDGVAWNVFYVIAPDGLCYWFGERQPG